MSVQYDNYLREHRANVAAAYDWLEENLPQVIGPTTGFGPRISHDHSKGDVEEYDAYDAYFYGGNRSYEVVNNFRLAWLHHIHANPHHWQYWVLINDDEGTMALEMDYPEVIEMICDWWSFSHKTGNLYEIFDWYEEHKPNMILHDNTKKLVESILSLIKDKLDSLK